MPAVTKSSIEKKAARTMALGLLVAGALSASACVIDSRSSGPEQVDPGGVLLERAGQRAHDRVHPQHERFGEGDARHGRQRAA